MTSSRRNSDPKREVHVTLTADVADADTLEQRPSQVSKSLLVGVHLTQLTIAGIFCLVCYWIYAGELPTGMERWWTMCLALLAVAWTAALPLFGRLWRFVPAFEARLSFWGSYWIALLGLPILIPLIATSSLGRKKPGFGRHPLPEAMLRAGVVTTWLVMQVAAYFACEKALAMTLSEDASLKPFWSFVFVYGTCLALPLALMSAALDVRKRRLIQAANARDMITGTRSLMPGEAVVHGVVELAEGETRAVRMEIDQEGTEHESSGSWSHSWKETGRRLLVRPFYLRTTAGERVRVLAGDDAKLMDALDGKILVNRTARTCTAELTPGEVVSAFGQLSRERDPEAAPGVGYRSPTIGWVLRPPDGGWMLLSSHPIDRPFQERARRISWWASCLLSFVIAGQCLLLGYHSRIAFGRPVAATVTAAKVVKEDTDDGYKFKRVVTVNLPAARTPREAALTEEVTEESYPNAAPGRTITVISDPVFSTFNFGEHPTAPFWVVFEAALIVLLCLIVRNSDRPDARWYLEKPLEEQGSGRLPETKTKPSGDSLSEIRALVDQELAQKSAKVTR